MNVHQQEQKRMKAEAHRRIQKRKKDEALSAAEDASINLGKSGARLKRPRKEPDIEIMRSVMHDYGFVPNGKGGWRKHIQVVRQAKNRIEKGS
jgi:hypothetical protein